jgi:drug/metabolite transporter (DMT)-like permease
VRASGSERGHLAALAAVIIWPLVPGYSIPVALGAQTVPAGERGLLIATEPAFIVAFTLLLQRRRVRWRVIGGCAVALAGVALTSGVLTSPRTMQWAGALEADLIEQRRVQ